MLISLLLACSQESNTTDHTPPHEIAAPSPAPAAPQDTDTICASKAAIEPPASDAATEAERTALAGCDSEALYYGIGIPKDPVAARKCAMLERSKQLMYGGEAILMMIYANGQGVPRNDDLATKFACVIGGAPAEIAGRVEHLQQRREDPNAPPDFDLCDDITSGLMMGHCAAHARRVGDVARAARKSAFIASLAPAERAAFDVLDKAAADFFSARVDGEVDLSGTARAMFQIEEEVKLAEDFLAALTSDFSPPSVTPEAFAAADAELNAIYKSAMRCAADSACGTINPVDLRNTERAWMVYRDAWAKFGTLVRPNTTPEAWKTWAVRARIEQLEQMAP